MSKTAIRSRAQRARETQEQTANRNKKQNEYIKSIHARETPEEAAARLENYGSYKRLWRSTRGRKKIEDDGFVWFDKRPLNPNYVYRPRPRSIIKRTPEERKALKRGYYRAFMDRQKANRLKKMVESNDYGSSYSEMNTVALDQLNSEAMVVPLGAVKTRLVAIEYDSESESEGSQSAGKQH